MENIYIKPENKWLRRKLTGVEVGACAALIVLTAGAAITLSPTTAPVTAYYSQEGTSMERLAAVNYPLNEIDEKERALVFNFTGKKDLSTLTKEDWKKVFDNCP